MLEAIETGGRADWPVLVHPLRALRALSADPELALRYPLTDGSEASALEIQRRYLQAVFAMHNGNITHAAEHAGINRRHFRTLLRKHAIIDG